MTGRDFDIQLEYQASPVLVIRAAITHDGSETPAEAGAQDRELIDAYIRGYGTVDQSGQA